MTPEGFPLAYEVLPGNTSDKTTLRAFLHKIETQYGKAQRARPRGGSPNWSRRSSACQSRRCATAST